MARCIEHKQKRPYGDGAVVISGKRVKFKLHRKAYADSQGISILDIKDVVIRHTCDNARCINPEHLIAGTQLDNIQDMVDRGRTCKGDKNGQSKLDWTTVRKIRAEYVPQCRINGQVKLAARYGVNQSVISEIVRGLTWQE